MTSGATLTTSGVNYRMWAPRIEQATVEVAPAGLNKLREFTMQKDSEGYHTAHDPEGAAGDTYSYRLGGEKRFPDPASRAQASDVHGRSLVIDPAAFSWSDSAWQRLGFRDLVIYELHVGTFTEPGTFRAAAEKLAHLQNLGINAIQLLPIADFPGSRNWGYDGVLIYAPAHCYGKPDDLRHLVNAAHAHGIAVILDVVYNHLGPDGNYLSAYSPYYFGKQHQTPWGDGYNFDAAHSGPVRKFFRENPPYWMEEFHIDGFRFDATHEIRDDSHPHILREMTDDIHRRGGYVIAEDARNEAKVVSPEGLGFDALWADDFHHAVRVSQTQENFSYFGDFTGTLEEVTTTIKNGWFYSGQLSPSMKMNRGTDGSHLPPERFVHCISNHDQTGNRAKGERIGHLISPPAYRAISTLLCLSPYTPMLFMGQEWDASSPFEFFCDHHGELGKAVSIGRQREFVAFPEFAAMAKAGKVPDPQAESTFQNSKLHWDELPQPAHARCLDLYKACLALRKAEPAFRPVDRTSWEVEILPGELLALTFGANAFTLIANLGGEKTVQHSKISDQHHLVLSSEEERFGGTGPTDFSSGTIHFAGPESLLFRST